MDKKDSDWSVGLGAGRLEQAKDQSVDRVELFLVSLSHIVHIGFQTALDHCQAFAVTCVLVQPLRIALN